MATRGVETIDSIQQQINALMAKQDKIRIVRKTQEIETIKTTIVNFGITRQELFPPKVKASKYIRGVYTNPNDGSTFDYRAGIPPAWVRPLAARASSTLL